MDQTSILLKLQTSHRQLQTSHRQLQTSHRRVQKSHRQIADGDRRVTDESQTTTDESQMSHRRLRRKVFLNTFIKHYFQKEYGFQMPLRKDGFYLKKESLRFDVYQSDGNSPTQEIRQF